MQINVQFSKQSMQFDSKFTSYQQVTEYVGAEPYDGSYEVIPKVDAQTLPTAKKIMLENVQIHAIPIFEVSNQADGETVYIASEVDIYGD